MNSNHLFIMTSLLNAPFAALGAPVFIAEIDPARWIVIVLPLAGLAFSAIGLIGALVYADRNRRRRHETIRLALEKGQPVPPEVLDENQTGSPSSARRKAGRDDRRAGIVLLGIAAGMFVAFAGVGAGGAKWLAALPAFLGLALLINRFIEGPRTPPTPPVA